MVKLFDAFETGVTEGRLESIKPPSDLAKALPQYIADATKKKDKKIDKIRTRRNCT